MIQPSSLKSTMVSCDKTDDMGVSCSDITESLGACVPGGGIVGTGRGVTPVARVAVGRDVATVVVVVATVVVLVAGVLRGLRAGEGAWAGESDGACVVRRDDGPGRAVGFAMAVREDVGDERDDAVGEACLLEGPGRGPAGTVSDAMRAGAVNTMRVVFVGAHVARVGDAGAELLN